MRTQALLLQFLAISILGGCAADLVPLRKDGSANGPDNIPIAYCNFGGAGLIITIKNQGNDSAPASVTSVIFNSRDIGTVVTNFNTPALASGSSYNHDIPIPNGCSDPDCGFEIRADSTKAISESNESNNNVGGLCIG